jgi:hypothetical protein
MGLGTAPSDPSGNWQVKREQDVRFRLAAWFDDAW